MLHPHALKHISSYVTALRARFHVYVLRDLCPRPHPLNVPKRIKFVILNNMSLQYGCNNGHGCRNKCTQNHVIRTCMVCVVHVRMRPLISTTQSPTMRMPRSVKAKQVLELSQ